MARESTHPPDDDTRRPDEARGPTPDADAAHDIDAQQQALNERAQRLGATAEELQDALGALALQAEAVLHRLRGGRLH